MMRSKIVPQFAFAISLMAPCLLNADTHFVSLSGKNIPPSSSMASAATSIQSAIDASEDGDGGRVTRITLEELELCGVATLRKGNNGEASNHEG